MIWSLIDGIDLIRQVEQIVIPLGYHAALAGSVLMKGGSDKDLDIILYKHNKKVKVFSKKRVLKALEQCNIINHQRVEFFEYDKKYVYKTEYLTKRIDIFFI